MSVFPAYPPGPPASHEATFDGVGGVEVFWRCWLPEGGGGPAAVVVIAHGISEHSGRYGHVAAELTAAGHAVYALDHRGHGRTGSGAYLDRLDNAVADLRTFVGLAAERHPGAPLFLLGHSMGGCMADGLRDPPSGHPDRADPFRPALDLGAATPFELAMARLLSALAPRLGVVAIDAAGVSTDPEVVENYEADPLNHHGKLPARSAAEMSTAIGRLEAEAPRITVPLLVLHGEGDELVSSRAAEWIHGLAGSADKKLVLYPGMAHEILNEPEREKVIVDILAWLAAHLGAGRV